MTTQHHPNDKSNQWITDTQRVVVKVGSGVLTTRQGLNLEVIQAITHQVSRLIKQGRQVLLVSSGAMAAGFTKIGLDQRPEDVPGRQAVAAVGQAGLIREYEKTFANYGLHVAQILLTDDGLTHRRRYLNARNTLNKLLDWQIVPIINENDTVSIDEIQFGDNDNLSAMIALLMDADLLINLTDKAGLFDKDPAQHPDACLIPTVLQIDPEVEAMASGIPGALGTGGMLSKIRAARKVTTAGIPMIIANGMQVDILDRLFAGESAGTLFVPNDQRLANRKCWIAFNLKPQGTLNVDAGAAQALLHNGKSLLPSGITGVENEFEVGAAVAIQDPRQTIIGTGLVNYSSSDIRKLMGLQTSQISAILGTKPYDEVIHRDNMAIVNGC